MYLLPCPHCSSALTVSPSQAGGQVDCQSCGGLVVVPKLGELRQLPRSGEQASDGPSPGVATVDSPAGPRVGFAIAAVLATISLLIAGFSAVRWAMIDVPLSTPAHIAQFAEAYQTVEPAALIREFEQMEERGLELPLPYKYKTLELTKQAWGRNAVVAGILAGITFTAAVTFLNFGRKTASR